MAPADDGWPNFDSASPVVLPNAGGGFSASLLFCEGDAFVTPDVPVDEGWPSIDKVPQAGFPNADVGWPTAPVDVEGWPKGEAPLPAVKENVDIGVTLLPGPDVEKVLLASADAGWLATPVAPPGVPNFVALLPPNMVVFGGGTLKENVGFDGWVLLVFEGMGDATFLPAENVGIEPPAVKPDDDAIFDEDGALPVNKLARAGTEMVDELAAAVPEPGTDEGADAPATLALPVIAAVSDCFSVLLFEANVPKGEPAPNTEVDAPKSGFAASILVPLLEGKTGVGVTSFFASPTLVALSEGSPPRVVAVVGGGPNQLLG